MTSVPDLLIAHGVAVLFASAFVVQAGAPARPFPCCSGPGPWITLGYLCADAIGLLANRTAGFGSRLVIAAGLVLYVALKYAKRRRFMGHLERARITAADTTRCRDDALRNPGRALARSGNAGRSTGVDPQGQG